MSGQPPRVSVSEKDTAVEADLFRTARQFDS